MSHIRSWWFWLLAGVCALVNIALMVEIVATVLTKENLAQLEMSLLLIVVLFACPVAVVSIVLTVVVLYQRTRGYEDNNQRNRAKLRLRLAIINSTIPFLFVLFFISVKAFGYYWT
jgi:hypothetical protein